MDQPMQDPKDDVTDELTPEVDEEKVGFNQPEGFSISDISIKTEQHSADHLIDLLEHEEINMETPFQRSSDLWRPDVMSRFIESMLLKFPIPPFYFDISYKEEKRGKQKLKQPFWQVVDGLQRLSAIRKFVVQKDPKKQLRLTGLDFFPELNGCTYQELPRSLVRNLHSCQISLFLIYPNTPKVVKHRIFERVNTGGLKLTDQEIRHALNQGRAPGVLQQAVSEGLIENNINIEPGRMRDQELVLRHFAFKIFGLDAYDKSMKVFLDNAMEELNNLPTNKAEVLIEAFVKSVGIITASLGRLAFRKALGDSINRSLFDSYTVVISNLSKAEQGILLRRKEIFQKNYISSLDEKKRTNARYIESISAATARADNVVKRFEVAKSVIRKTIND